MSEVGEAIGTAAEGGLIARVLSRRTARDTRPAAGHFEESACVNCGTALIGPHCHQCGQPAHLHRTLGALGHDIMHGVLHLDGKIWRTLPLLAWKPGELTRRYIHGERAKFVSPMALFLFSIFLMFAVFQAVGMTPPTDITATNIDATMTEARRDVESEIARDRAEMARMLPGGRARVALEREIAEKEERLADLRKVEVGKLNDMKITVDDDGRLTGVEFIDTSIIKKWQQNPSLMLYKLQANSYKFSWLLIPVSLPFMWLLFAWKRGVRMYDHAIFVTYSIAFMSMLFLTASLLARWGAPDGLVVPLVSLLPAWHIYRQLRGAYRLGRFSALWRLAVLTAMIMIVIVIFLQILLVLGAF